MKRSTDELMGWHLASVELNKIGDEFMKASEIASQATRKQTYREFANELYIIASRFKRISEGDG